MKSGWMAAVVVIGAVSMVGCVSQKKYEEAMVDVDSAKFELERTQPTIETAPITTTAAIHPDFMRTSPPTERGIWNKCRPPLFTQHACRYERVVRHLYV